MDGSKQDSSNRYLSGIYAPVTVEETLSDLRVEGTIPGHLDGRYVRIGPNPIGPVDPASYHWFVGDGMVHGIRLRDGRAEWCRNRWVRSARVAELLGEQPHRGPIHAYFDFAANTNVIGHAGRTFAIVEAGPNPYELTDELETIGPSDFSGTLDGGFSAHPHRDPATGDLHSISYFWGWGNQVRYRVVDRGARVIKQVDIATTGSTMLHDCALTATSIIVFDLPVTFDLEAAAAAASLPYRWNRDYPARVGLVDRAGTGDAVQWFSVDPCYVFHTLNAYDDGDTVVIDLVRHDRMFATDFNGPNEGLSRLERWVLDRGTSTVRTSVLADGGHEFPRIDERLATRAHRFGYTLGISQDDEGNVEFFDALHRHDLVTGSKVTRGFGASSSVGEFVFVPTDDEAAEDDGVLMGFVHDATTNTGRLEILDAATLETMAAVRLPVRVPMGFHGNWLPADATVN